MRTMQNVRCCLLLLLAMTACNTRGGGMQDNQEQPQHFATLEEAARKAKTDFLAVLRSARDVSLGVDAATLERSNPAEPVKRVDLDFDKLLAADSNASIDALVKSERNTVVPFVADNSVVTIVEVNRDAQGWRVIGLAGKDIADDLTTLRGQVGAGAQTVITLYEVPNLQARVYGARTADGEVLFTNYGNRFTISQGVPASVLIPVLKADAITFQRQYGDALKRGQLLR